MRNRRRLGLLGMVAGLFVALALSVGFQRPAEAAVYSAGNERAGTHICRCPVNMGNCVCEYTY